MNLESLKSLDYKKVLNRFSQYYRNHNFTALIIIAGVFVGYSLLRIDTLNQTIANPDPTALGEEAEPLILPKLTINEETEQRLMELAEDQDVIIDSNLPDSRNNPFN